MDAAENKGPAVQDRDLFAPDVKGASKARLVFRRGQPAGHAQKALHRTLVGSEWHIFLVVSVDSELHSCFLRLAAPRTRTMFCIERTVSLPVMYSVKMGHSGARRRLRRLGD